MERNEITISRKLAKQHVEVIGWAGFLNTIQMVFEDCDIYQMSKEWYTADKYNIKCKGSKGDALIRLI